MEGRLRGKIGTLPENKRNVVQKMEAGGRRRNSIHVNTKTDDGHDEQRLDTGRVEGEDRQPRPRPPTQSNIRKGSLRCNAGSTAAVTAR